MVIRGKRFSGTKMSILILLGVTALAASAAAQQQAPEAAPSVAASAPAAAVERPGTYTVKQGDTLWDIASAMYRDPFLWPLIWQSNPSIANPDLIYAGSSITIPSLGPVERAMSEPQEAAAPVEEKAAPAPAAPAPAPAAPAPKQAEAVVPSFFRQKVVESTVPEPETRAPEPGSKLVMPADAPAPLVDKLQMISGGFVSEADSEDIIIGSVDETEKGIHGKNVRATGHEVYIKVTSRQQVNVGDRFLVYEAVHDVEHPVTGKYMGQLYKVNGIVKVVAVNENKVYTATIIISWDAVMKDNLLAPYQEPELIYPSKEKREKTVSGYILEVTDRRVATGQLNVVYLDRGKEDGVSPGDRFLVYAGKMNESGVPQYLGEVQVFIVKDRTSTALIRKSVNEIAIGDIIQYKN